MSDATDRAARPLPPEDLPRTAQLILAAAKDILAERGYAELTITAISQVSGVNRALVSYYFGGKAGLLAALVDSLFLSPEVGSVEEVSAGRGGADLAGAFLDWQRGVSANDRVNRMLYELLPHALRDPQVRARFAEEYRVYRQVDGECLAGAPRELGEQELESLAAVSIAVVEGLGIQRALDPDGFDHEAAWRAWRAVIGSYLSLPG
ncbi:MAG TPA: TetR/AcrR family transcriptional regulator [Thermoleophilia bacterium]|nr:TetR/AcrR family transcriptional regulator [Thermoleophilia bacterium]